MNSLTFYPKRTKANRNLRLYFRKEENMEMNTETEEELTLLTNMGIKGEEPFKLVGLLDASFCMSDMKNLGICIGIKNWKKTKGKTKYSIMVQVLLVSDSLLIVNQVEELTQMVFTVEEVLKDPDAAFDAISDAAIVRYHEMKSEKAKRMKKSSE